MNYAVDTGVRYWQDKATGKVIACSPNADTSSREWNLAFRAVRLLHHPESCCVMAEDVSVCLSALDDPNVVELDIDQYYFWLAVYANPDL